MSDPSFGITWRRAASGLWLPSGLGEVASPPARSVAQDAAPYLIATVPVLAPLLTIVVLGDPAILRVLLMRGNLTSLFIGLLQPFLPVVIGSVLFLAVYRLSRGNIGLAAISALVITSLLLLFVPIVMVIIEIGFVAALLLLLWPTGRRQRWRRNVFVAGAAVLVIGAIGTSTLWWISMPDKSSVLQLLSSRTLNALPREVSIEKDGAVGIHYLIAADERITTVITGSPTTVRNIKTTDIAIRLPCRHRERLIERTPASLIFRLRDIGTPYCENLAVCLRSVPSIITRVEKAVMERCIIQSRAQ